MAAILIEAPESEPLSLSEAKNYLRVGHDADDALIQSMISAARIQVESRTRRALLVQTWRVVLDRWPPSGAIVSPVSPLREVVAARVRDEAGDAQALDPDIFILNTGSSPGLIVFDAGRVRNDQLSKVKTMKRFFSRGLAAAFFILVAAPAIAQTEVHAESIYNVLQPYLVAIISVLATAIVGWLAELLRRKFNLDIDAAHRDALQTALTNGAGLLIGKAGSAFAGKKLDLKSAVLAEAVNYVLQAVPDAIRHFGITPEAVAEKLQAKLPQVSNSDA